jgi:hypothetical protein
MNANVTAAAHLITDEEFRAEFNRLEQAKRAEEIREQNRRSAYNGKVWYTKGRDDYGRTVRTIKTMEDGVSRTLGVVVLVPRWTADLKASMGTTKFFSNNWDIKDPTSANPAVAHHDTLKEAMARFNCGTKEYELY